MDTTMQFSCSRQRWIFLFSIFGFFTVLMFIKVDKNIPESVRAYNNVTRLSVRAYNNVTRLKSFNALYHNWTPKDKLDLTGEPHFSEDSLQANCIIKSQPNGCEVAVINSDTNFSLNACKRNAKLRLVEEFSQLGASISVNEQPKVIFAITPTYIRDTQKVDLTSLCQTIMHVQTILWIVVEDSEKKTILVSDLLGRCKVKAIQLNIHTLPENKKIASGVEQRNLGLNWIREYCSKVKYCTGSVYFMDDDNKYDLRLFEEIEMNQQVSVFPVGFSGGMRSEGPICDRSGSVISWNAKWKTDRAFPIDMAGFAVHVDCILSKPNVWMGFDKSGKTSVNGFLESDFLENFSSRETVECRGNNREVLVWHVRTKDPSFLEIDVSQKSGDDPTDYHDFEV